MKLLSLVAIAGALWLGTPLHAEGGTTDEQKLQGTWKVESFQFNGMPVDSMQDALREFSDGKYTLTPASGEVFRGSVTLDPSKKPKQIDLDLSDRTLKGIYELDGDTLRISYALEGDQRPTQLASKPDSGVVLIVHKRQK